MNCDYNSQPCTAQCDAARCAAPTDVALALRALNAADLDIMKAVHRCGALVLAPEGAWYVTAQDLARRALLEQQGHVFCLSLLGRDVARATGLLP